MRSLLTVLLTTTVLFASASAFAEDPHSPASSAEGHYQAAVRLFGEARYREALDEFDAAIEISPESIFYCNRAIVLIQLQEPEAALESLETCQRTHSGGAAELAEIDAQRAAVAVMLENVRESALDTVSSINAPMLAAPDVKRGWGLTETGVLLAGVGVAALASAATLDFLSQDLRDDLAASATPTLGSSYQEGLAQYEELRTQYVTRQRIWLGLTAAGGLLTLTGATLVALEVFGSKESGVEVGVNPITPGVRVKLSW